MKLLTPYHTSFVLDKAHFSECFDQSTTSNGAKDYIKTLIVAVLGVTLILWIDVSKYLAYFVLSLAAIEGASVYYRKTWWLWRQMISKAYEHTVEIKVTNTAVITTSFHINSELAWSDITNVSVTECGLLLHHQGGVSYLSNSYLSDEIIEFIITKSSNEGK